MDLIIAEKPSAAEKIAFALGSPKKLNYKGVKYFSVDDKIIVPAVGHLFALKEKEKEFPSLNLEWQPVWKINKKLFHTKKYLDLIEKFKNCDRYIVATDYDLEGEVIGANILKFLGKFDVGLRMKFSTLTREELRNSYLNLEKINEFNVNAGETRHYVDWLYGINLSRFLMMALKKKRVLSIGRVQGPMLSFLVKREQEIENFIPKDFWKMYVYIKNFKFEHVKGEFFSREEVEKAQNNTEQKGIVRINKKKRILLQPLPLDFTSLQIEAYNNFKFPPIKTEEIAQQLYMKAMISYPRTSSQKLPQKLGLKNIIEKIGNNPKYKDYANYLISNNKFKPREGKKTDAHPAIFPTGIIEKMSTDEEKLYDLIVRRFLACFYDPAELEEREITIDLKEKYKAKFLHIVKDGWLLVYNPGIKEDEIPVFEDGEKVKIDKIEIKKDQTKPPKRYTPAEIIKKLEKENIGTKTTRPLILDNLYKRGYIESDRIKVLPLGFTIYNLFSNYAPEVVDVKLTRDLEKDMEKIQIGKVSKEEVIEKTKRIITNIIEKMMKRKEEISKELSENINKIGIKCNCGGDLKIMSKSGKKFIGCSNYPKCKTTYSLPEKFKFLGRCDLCGAPKILVFGKRKYSLCLNKNCKKDKKR